jgi:hypothetical protein
MALRIDIAAPCSETWESMQGDERVRHCASCKLNVFNTKELTEKELLALLSSANGGRVCGRVYKRADGTVLTKDCPTGVAMLRRRVLMGISLAASFVLVLLGYRATNAPSCEVDANSSWLTRIVQPRFVSAREELRKSQFFGSMINELWPLPRASAPGSMMLGKMKYVPPKTPGAASTKTF